MITTWPFIQTQSLQINVTLFWPKHFEKPEEIDEQEFINFKGKKSDTPLPNVAHEI